MLTSLLTDIQKDVTKEIPQAQLWRVLGDEIIFFVTIRDIEEIYSTIDAIYGILVLSNVKLKNEKFFEKIDADKEILSLAKELLKFGKENIEFLKPYL